MESMGKKPRRRRSFIAEFKAEIVELCQRGDRSIGQVSKDFDLTETAVREWLKQARRGRGRRCRPRSPVPGTAGRPCAAPSSGRVPSVASVARGLTRTMGSGRQPLHGLLRSVKAPLVACVAARSRPRRRGLVR
jgi:transposase-like protein